MPLTEGSLRQSGPCSLDAALYVLCGCLISCVHGMLASQANLARCEYDVVEFDNPRIQTPIDHLPFKYSHT